MKYFREVASLGSKEKAALILLVMRNDEALPDHEKENVKRLLVELEESLPVDELQRIKERAESLDFAAICSDQLLSTRSGS